MPSIPLKKSQAVTLPLVTLFIGLFFVSVTILAPGSRASLQSGVSNTSSAARDVSGKRARPDFVPGEALVRFKKGRAIEGTTYIAVPRPVGLALPKAADAQENQEQVLARIERFEGSDLVDGLRLARVNPWDTEKAIAALKARSDVMYAEPNYILRADSTTPNDTRFGQLYGLAKIGAPDAWDSIRGSSDTVQSLYGNPRVVVGVVDQGIDTSHIDLQGNIWTNPTAGGGDITGITGDINGYDFHNNTGTVFSGNSSENHATHVAGTIGARGDNNEGVVGVNWQVSLMSLKFLSPTGSDADAIRAYSYAKQMRELWISSGGTKGANIRVLNNSYGGSGYSQTTADAISALGQAGILFVAAAGNDGTDNDVFPHYPSSYSLPNVISVTGTNQTDNQIYNYGAHSVLIGAPASGILSTTPGNAYLSFSGTSMATPHVSGAAALLCAAYPTIGLSHLRGALAFNGDLLPSLQGRSLTGRRLNVKKSLEAIASNDSTPPGTPTGLQVTSQSGRTVNLSWTASGDDGPDGQASLYDLSFTDQSTGAVVPLTTLAPPPAGTVQSQSVKLPYRHTAGVIRLREFDNIGNEGTPATVNVNVDPNVADPYVATVVSPAALSGGGIPLGLTFDDRYKENYVLPFSFPFFGQLYSTVTISTNGNLYFSAPPKRGNGDADDVPGSIADMTRYKMISGMWDDLDLRTSRRADADVYVKKPDATRIIFRWQGVQFGDGTNGDPINFEIELRADGTVKTRYGSGNTNLNPVVGVSAGEPDAYVIDSLTSETNVKNLTNATGGVFTPRVLRNPIDDQGVFVAQHYFDFLNRAPDDGGFTYWLNEITKCGSDLQCIEARRIAVSDAFFFEPEYQRSGAYVFRVYRLAFGNTQPFPNPDAGDPSAPFYPGPNFRFKFPSHSKFRADRLLVVGGGDLTQQQFNFANTFVQRAEFLVKYPSTLATADQFVDAVLANILSSDGVDLSSQRGALLTLYSQGGRGAVIYRLSDDDAAGNPINNRAFIDAEYNLSFIMNEYAAYLRRDGDANGMNFWLGQVNSGPLRDPAKQHAMVCSFITSQEYQQRFSPVFTRTNALCSGVQ